MSNFSDVSTKDKGAGNAQGIGMSDIEGNTPGVVAFRVGLLERTVKEGFDRQSDKMDNILSAFVTKTELYDAKQESDRVHVSLQHQLDRVNNNIGWAVKIVLGIVMAALLASIGLYSYRG